MDIKLKHISKKNKKISYLSSVEWIVKKNIRFAVPVKHEPYFDETENSINCCCEDHYPINDDDTITIYYEGDENETKSTNVSKSEQNQCR